MAAMFLFSAAIRYRCLIIVTPPEMPHFFSHPGDQFNRYWEPYSDGAPVVESQGSVAPAAFWNKPPEDVFRRGVTASRGDTLELQWPPAPLPKASYYLALYFQDNRTPSPLSWRVFDVAVNGQAFFAGLNVSTAGSMLYGAAWPLSGQTKITLTPAPGSPVGPVINAAEVMMVVPLGGRTHPRDGNKIRSMQQQLPCAMADSAFPHENSVNHSCILSFLLQ